MAANASKQVACSICNKSYDELKEGLYICVKEHCPKGCEAYCEKCGSFVHQTISDPKKKHTFDITQDYIQKVDIKTIQRQINEGSAAVTQALALHHSTQNENMRAIIQVAAAGLMHSGGAAYVAAYETILHTYRFMKGEIATWEEYGYHVAKGITTAIGAGIGGWAGAKAGAAAGSVIGGPIGAFIGGIIGGIAGAYVARKAYEYAVPDDFIQTEQIGREKMIRDSLKLFGFSSVKDIENPDIFNEREIKQTYHTLAKRYHPDKNGGTPESHQKFHEITAAYGVLLSLLVKKDKSRAVKQMKEIRAIKWKRDIKDLSKKLKEEKLMWIVDVCVKWKDNLSIAVISGMRKEDILEMLKDLNADWNYRGIIGVAERNRFANIVDEWKSLKDDDGDNQYVDAILQGQVAVENGNAADGADDQDVIEQNDDNENSQEDVVEEDVHEDIITQLKDELEEKNLLHIADILEEYDGEYCLESLLEYEKRDILEAINEVNDDESNQHKIKVSQKNKFAKIIRKFAAN